MHIPWGKFVKFYIGTLNGKHKYHVNERYFPYIWVSYINACVRERIIRFLSGIRDLVMWLLWFYEYFTQSLL